MNDLVRASSLFGGQRAPSAGLSGVLGTVANPPPEVAQLPVGTTLQGVVTGRDGAGHLLVRTELGTLSVATKATLPVDSEVTLQIRSSGTQLHVLLMHSEAPPASAQGAQVAPGPPELEEALESQAQEQGEQHLGRARAHGAAGSPDKSASSRERPGPTPTSSAIASVPVAQGRHGCRVTVGGPAGAAAGSFAPSATRGAARWLPRLSSAHEPTP
ncbi:MAG: hypothetical protein IH786_03785 [Proteobacteria bacterium]|nr:hypothetical protein [Pseudomonadota bacterium]